MVPSSITIKNFHVVILLLSTLSQYVTNSQSENEDGDLKGRHDSGNGQPEGLTKKQQRFATIKLEDYPNYTYKLNLKEFKCSPSSGEEECEFVVMPGEAHGVSIFISYSNSTSRWTVLEAASRHTAQEFKTILASPEQVVCTNYLEVQNNVINSPSSVIIRHCSFARIENSRPYVYSYFDGESNYVHKQNENTTLVLTANALLFLNNYVPTFEEMPILTISTYAKCSNLQTAELRRSKKCATYNLQNAARTDLYCLPSRLLCDGNFLCGLRNHSGQQQFEILTDETECLGRISGTRIRPAPLVDLAPSTTYSPLFPTRSSPSTLEPEFPAVESVTNGTSTTTKRPWWKPVIPPFVSPSETTTTTTTTTEKYYERSSIHEGEEIHRTPWYSPSSPFGTVIIFIAVVILVFGICSFLAKVHSTRPVYLSNASSNCESTEAGRMNERPFSIESNSFARQLIEMIEEEENRRNNYIADGRRSPMRGHVDQDGIGRSTTTLIVDHHGNQNNTVAPPPSYLDDATLPSYDSLFANNNSNSQDKPK